MTLEVFKTAVFFTDHDQGFQYLIDTISYQDRWWLVGLWRESISTLERTPDILVLLDGLPHQEVTGQRFRFLLNNAIPKSVLGGQEQAGYVVAKLHPPADTQAQNDNRPN